MSLTYTSSQSIYGVGLSDGFNIGVFSARFLVDSVDTSWRKSVRDQLNALCALKPGWDGYQAGPVSFDNANFALRMLESICGSDTPPPQIVPGSDGDLQIEWHMDGGDIELHVQAPYRVSAWANICGVEHEDDLKTDFRTPAEWVVQLQESCIAQAAAA